MAVSAFTNIPTGLKQKNNHPLDGRTLYNTIEEALADNPVTVDTVTVPPSNMPTEVIETNRFIGQKMVIVNPPEGDSPREYWFRDGITDDDLVEYDSYEWENVDAGSGGGSGGGSGNFPPSALGVPVKAMTNMVAATTADYYPNKDTYYYLGNKTTSNETMKVNMDGMTGLTDADIGKIYTFTSNCSLTNVEANVLFHAFNNNLDNNSVQVTGSNPRRLMFAGFMSGSDIPRFILV